ncbi:hypothetical protein ACFC4G_38845 [Streptomyces sp. NPDC056002]|uniref:hypothetical protein n=1 Tax=Streptomyces sp. NPDC056002 TaxID=3345675 RepID=UPI0035E1541F
MGLQHSARLRKHEVEALLHLPPGKLDRLLAEAQDFPRGERKEVNSMQRALGEKAYRWWDGSAVYAWAATTPRFRDHGAILLNPAVEARSSAPGKWIGFQPTSQGPAMDWETGLGVIRLLHTTHRGAATAMAEELAEVPDAQGVVTVCSLFGDIGATGPALIAADTAQPQLEYEAQWGTVTKLVGQRLPWWPALLRRADVISQWSPGAPVTIAELLPDEEEMTLRGAAGIKWPVPDVQTALTDLANALRNQRVDSVNRDSRIFSENGATPDGAPLLVAARHPTEGFPLPRTDDRELLAQGWRVLASSQLFEAYEPLAIVMRSDPTVLPFGAKVKVSDRSLAARHWAKQLRPCDPSALHAVLADDAKDVTFHMDPSTGTPAVRTRTLNGDEWIFLAPLRLPGRRAQLKSVILDDTVWVSTTDGRIYPAPHPPYEHLWWGYGAGDRPTEAAWVIAQLLDDLSSHVTLADHWASAPQGLTKLLNHPHQSSTELPRSALELARAQQNEDLA